MSKKSFRNYLVDEQTDFLLYLLGKSKIFIMEDFKKAADIKIINISEFVDLTEMLKEYPIFCKFYLYKKEDLILNEITNTAEEYNNLINTVKKIEFYLIYNSMIINYTYKSYEDEDKKYINSLMEY